MSMAERRAELLADVEAHVAQVLRDLGIDTERAEHCGCALADHLASHWGGQVVSYPMDHGHRLSKRERAILADRDAGMSIPELCLKWQIGQSGLYKLIKRAQRRAAIDAQQDLFSGAEE